MNFSWGPGFGPGARIFTRDAVMVARSSSIAQVRSIEFKPIVIIICLWAVTEDEVCDTASRPRHFHLVPCNLD